MPTYDYRCDACGHELELFQSMSEPAKRKCPDCGKLKLKRLIGTGAAVIFKGSGFYETDYRSDGYKKAAEAEKKAVEGGKSESKKSDTAKTTDSAKSDKSKKSSDNGSAKTSS